MEMEMEMDGDGDGDVDIWVGFSGFFISSHVFSYAVLHPF